MIKESNLNQYYAEIAHKLNDIIPEEWKKIILYAEDLGDVSSTSFYFHTKEDNAIHYSGNIPEEFSVSKDEFRILLRELRSIIRSFRNEFEKEHEELWYTLTFILDESWRFKADFGYEIDEEKGYLEREIIWAYENIGLVPEEEFGREVLKEYLGI